MLSWSNASYRLTLGVGGLATTGMLSELWGNLLPFWAILVVALLPFVVFVFVHPGELPDGIVRLAHVLAAVVCDCGMRPNHRPRDRPAYAPRLANLPYLRSCRCGSVRHRPVSGCSRPVSLAQNGAVNLLWYHRDPRKV